MTKAEYFAFVEARNAKKLAITKAKNADYTGGSGDPFANFVSVEKLGICTTEVGFLVRMMDKMMRLNSFVQKGVLEVKDESVDDTLSDLSNYADLLAGYIESKRKVTSSKPVVKGVITSAHPAFGGSILCDVDDDATPDLGSPV